MRAAIVQTNPIFGEKERNFNEISYLVNQENADLFILPELCLSGYQFVDENEVITLSDSEDSVFINKFLELSKKKESAIVFGFAEKTEHGIYNSSMLVTPSGEKHIYRKTHLFYKEKKFFKPGNSGFNVFDWKGLKIGLAICFDWYFPESFRTLALKGADIIAHSSNLVMPYCQQADFARALENRVYIFTANRVGTESRESESLTFTGESVAVSPRGEYILRLSKNESDVKSAEVDLNLSRNKNINIFNNIFEDRREDFYF